MRRSSHTGKGATTRRGITALLCAGNFSANASCAADAAATRAIVEKACVGKASCSLDASTGTMGGDPCTGTVKSLAVTVHCDAPPPPNASAPRSYGAGQTINAVPLHYGFPPTAADGASVLRALVDDINVTHGGHLTTGFVGKCAPQAPNRLPSLRPARARAPPLRL